MLETNRGWKYICEEKRERQQKEIPSSWIIEPPHPEQFDVMSVPADCGLLSTKELEITESVDAELLLRKLAEGEWTSLEVTTAYYKRAIVAHQVVRRSYILRAPHDTSDFSIQTNCLTEIFVQRALDRAKEVDDYLTRNGRPIGPLHGLPVSLKDQFMIKGLETVMGYVAWVGDYADRNSALVEILLELGAVPFVRTNVPQTLMWGETYNHVFGRTLNPFNRALTPGGSSGGEGALLAMKGSPLGIGTDIGGSLRIPSAFCGLYTLRPSYERLPYCGARNALEGQESISSVLGPMTNSIQMVKHFTKAVIDSQPWLKDPLCVRKRWDQEEYDLKEHGGRNSPLCFAIMWDNGIVKPFPPVRRAMEITKYALEKAGHKASESVISWIPHRHLEIYKNAETIFVADGLEDYLTHCRMSGEPLLKSMIPEEEDRKLPAITPYVQTLVGRPWSRSTYELWQLQKEKRALRKSHLDNWQETVRGTGTGRPVDAIISPVTAYPAPPHGLNTDAFYTTLVNAMDYTSCCFPVTSVDLDLDLPDAPHDFYNHEDKELYELFSNHTEIFRGSPVGLQLIGKTLEEEAVISMTEIVVQALKDFKE